MNAADAKDELIAREAKEEEVNYRSWGIDGRRFRLDLQGVSGGRKLSLLIQEAD